MENNSWNSSNFTDSKCVFSYESSLQLLQRYICITMEFAPVAIFVDRYVTICWYLVGMIGNSITIRIWSRRMNRSNISAMYLVVLAVTDLLYLFLHIFMELKFAWGISTIDAPGWCSLFFVLYMFAQYMSPLLVLGFTIERFISIISPFNSQRFSKINRGPFEIGGLSVIAVLLAFPQIFSWEFKGEECQGKEGTFYRVWTWISDVLVFCIFPLTSLILNSLVMRAVSKSDKNRRFMQSKSDYSLTKEKRTQNQKSSPTTITLLCVSFYRIFTVIPVTIVFALQHEFPYGDLHLNLVQIGKDQVWKNHFPYVRAKKIIDEIGLSQYCCNIFIYLITGSHFRHEMKNLLSFLPFISLYDHSNCLVKANLTDITTNGLDACIKEDTV